MFVNNCFLLVLNQCSFVLLTERMPFYNAGCNDYLLYMRDFTNVYCTVFGSYLGVFIPHFRLVSLLMALQCIDLFCFSTTFPPSPWSVLRSQMIFHLGQLSRVKVNGYIFTLIGQLDPRISTVSLVLRLLRVMFIGQVVLWLQRTAILNCSWLLRCCPSA